MATHSLSDSGYDVTPISADERDRLAADLSREERDVILRHGTEAPFCGTLLNNKAAGTYVCRLLKMAGRIVSMFATGVLFRMSQQSIRSVPSP